MRRRKPLSEETKRKIGLANSLPKTEIVCKSCGKSFFVPPHRLKKNPMYCSFVCMGLGNRGKLPASAWKKGHTAWNKGKPHLSGPRHWNWKGGYKVIPTKRKSFEYQQWRREVYKRDGFHCRKCGCSPTRKNPLHAHHLERVVDNPSLIFDLEFGVTLCKKCHLFEHTSQYKRKK